MSSVSSVLQACRIVLLATLFLSAASVLRSPGSLYPTASVSSRLPAVMRVALGVVIGVVRTTCLMTCRGICRIALRMAQRIVCPVAREIAFRATCPAIHRAI